MSVKASRTFQNACATIGTFKLIDIQRHQRLWQKTSLTAEEYITSHLPLVDDVKLEALACALNYGLSNKSIQLLQKDGVEIKDTLTGLFLTPNNAQKMRQFLTNYKPLEVLFNAITEQHPDVVSKASFTAFCISHNDESIFQTLCSKTGSSTVYYKDSAETIVSGLIESWLSSKHKSTSIAVADTEPAKVNAISVDAAIIKAPDNCPIALSQIVAELVAESNSKFDYRKNSVENRCRDKLHRFIENNEIWGIEPLMAVDVLPIHKGSETYYFYNKDVESIKRHLRLWIATYGFSDEKKLSLLLKAKSEEFPYTVALLEKYYMDSSRKETDGCSKNTVDFFLSILPTECNELTEDDIQETIIIPFMCEMSLNSQVSISSFLYQSKLTTRRYEFSPRVKHEIDITAYPLENYAIMQYISMNRDQIQTRNLISKAVDNKRFAVAWLYVICHFFAAWRSTDIVRLPIPELPYSGCKVLMMAKEGQLTQEEVEGVAAYEIALIESREMRPNKTRSSSNITQLQMYVPNEQRWVFGMALLIATAHYEMHTDEVSLVSKVNDIFTLRKFFGEDFVNACEGKNFSTRRANKAMLQSLSSTSTGTMAYLLPEIARNHKQSYGQLSPSTEVYLQDNHFAGVTPEFVINEMGKRGFCGFIKQILLETAFGDEFKNMPIKAQTGLIARFGIDTYGIERIEGIAAQAESTAAQTVKEILSSTGDKTQTAKDILLRLIDGKGKGKSGTCVLLAAGKPCADTARQNCIGCYYEILEVRLVLLLKREMDAAIQKIDAKDSEAYSMETNRQRFLLEEVIIPRLTEICATVKDYASIEELQILLDIAEKGLDTDVAG